MADFPTMEELELGVGVRQVLEDKLRSSEEPRAKLQALPAGGTTPEEELLEDDGLTQKECRECGERMWVMDDRVALCRECYLEEMCVPKVDEEGDEYGLVGEY